MVNKNPRISPRRPAIVGRGRFSSLEAHKAPTGSNSRGLDLAGMCFGSAAAYGSDLNQESTYFLTWSLARP
jgi:hypothetical protein